MFRFLHTADIHLDSPLKGLEAHENAPVEEIRGATRRAFDNCIDLAIDEAVDFLLIAGDLYDVDWKDYNTGLFFAGRMGRLHRAGIAVFIVSGNHDAANQITRTMPLPDNVTLFSSQKNQSIRLDTLGVIIHGRSYSSRVVTENLALQYPPCQPGYFNIGLLHTSLTGRQGHEEYAPCTLDELQSKGYDYWALGHVHKREIVADDPWIVFPGNIQGRHIRETGAKGATLITVVEGRITDVREHELDVLRWTGCEVDLSHCDTAQSVYDAVRRAFEIELAEANSRPLALRLILTGSCPVHTLLLERTAQWTEEFRGIGAGLGNIWLEKVKFQTTRRVSPEQTAESGGGDTALTGLLHAIEHFEFGSDTLVELVPELGSLNNKLPAEISGGDDPFLASSPERITELRSQVQELLRAQLLRHGAPK
ncbi:metallophosphoesterase family protein [Desulfocastanea catecholica]